MRVRALVVGSVLGLVSQVAALQTEQASLQLHVTVPPSRVSVEGADQGVYELQIRNPSSAAVRITRLDVTSGAAGPLLQTFAGDDLNGRLARLGANGSKLAPGVIAADARAVIYLELRLPTDPPVSELSHRLAYAPLTASAAPRSVEAAPVRMSRVTPVVLAAPLRGGPWAAVHSPAWERGHRRVFYAVDGRERIPGRFAIDWIKLDDEGRSARGDADLVANALGYGEDVLAVADALVSATRDNVDEVTRVSARRKHAPDDASGNYVALDLGDGRYVLYEHLKPGSIRVKPGQRVARGEIVAALGFTGDSTGPHLHLHVAAAASPLGAEGLPFVLDRFDVLGVYRDIADLGTRPWSPASTTPTRRERERPASNVVVQFETVR